MASGEEQKKKVDEESDLFAQLPGYTPFAGNNPGESTAAQQYQPQSGPIFAQPHPPGQPQPSGQSSGQPSAPINPSHPPQPAGPPTQNPWFPTQPEATQPPAAYPVNAGYVGPSQPLAPNGIVLPQLRPQDDPNSSEYIPRTPVLNAPAPNPHSPWTPVPEPKWELFVEENRNQPQPPVAPPQTKPLPAGGSQANPIRFNALPIVTGQNYQDSNYEQPVWPGAPQANGNHTAQQQNGSAQSQFAPAQQGAYLSSTEAEQQAQAIYQAQLGQPGVSSPLDINQNQNQNPNQTNQQQWPNAKPQPRVSNFEGASGKPKWRNKLLSDAGNAQQEELPPQSLGLSFSKNDILGIATYNLNVTKDILTNPQGYFQTLPLTGGFGEPLLYTVFTCILSSIMCAIGKLNPLMFFWAFIVSFISVTVGAVIVDQAFRRMGGKGDLEGTFRVLAFSKATFVFAWITLGPLSLGMMLATMITGYMNYIGLSRVHGLSPKNTAIIIALMSVLSLLFRWTCPGV